MKNILVPTDLSNIAENGLSVATDVAKRVNGRIFLVNFIKHPFGETWSATGDLYTKYDTDENLYTVQLIKKHEADLKTLAEKYADPESFKISTQVYDEDLKDGVEAYIKEYNIDLVVMGTSGEENVKEKFTGNHVEQVLREAPVPVISVKPNYIKQDIQNVIVGWDKSDSKDYKKAIGYINELSDALKAKLHVVHVTKSGSADRDKITTSLKDFATDHRLSNYSLHIVEDDDVEDGIIKYAKSVKAGLIMMLSNSLSGASIFTSSHSEDMTQESNVPVYTINLKNI